MDVERRTSLEFWYPKVVGVVPTPETRFFVDKSDLLWLLDGQTPPMFDKFLAKIHSAAQEIGGFPIFLRTGLTSGKHDWDRTCFVAGASEVAAHVAALVECSALAGFAGLPTHVWVVREMLRTEAAFHAFWSMPITKERRYFVRGGKVLGHQPYWPPESIENPDCDDWRERLDAIQQEPPDEVTVLSELSVRVNEAVPGCWSVDWLWVPDRGWVLTDMAVGSASFVWEDHPSAPDLASLAEE